MAELEKLQLELQEAVRESEKLKVEMFSLKIMLIYFRDTSLFLTLRCLHLILQMDLRNIPEEVVKETLEYKCLQSQFSLLYNESLGVKTQLDEARALLLTAKNAHLRQIEHMEVNFTEQAWFFSVIHQRHLRSLLRFLTASGLEPSAVPPTVCLYSSLS